MPNKVVLLGTVATSTVNFRGDLIHRLVAEGYDVYCLCTDFDEGSKASIVQMGAKPIAYGLSRAGMNPIADLSSILKIKTLFEKIKPDIVLSFFVKPVIYGSIAARLAGVKHRYAMLEGLGYVFTDMPSGLSLKQRALRKIQVFLYRLALPCIDKIIFLNHDDPVHLLKKNNLKAKSVHVLGGIGLNLKDYPFSPAPVKPVRFLFIGRLLAEKGVFEYIEAARLVKRQYPSAEFVLLGGLDEENPGGLKRENINKLLINGIIEFPGHVNNVPEWIAGSSVFVLPSYREGMPRSTQEAMAMGRAVITSDAPGCRETVEQGINGFIVPRWSACALAEKMIYFIENPSEITRMGNESHRIALDKFDANKVNQRLMEILELKMP
ncbi:glycosyltransferase family 4 protein [Aeromonas veronii]|uniref:glycosyltransferase family 4 protein n=1 Tax=Aeromonas veronii TaxID=654 RepID=UPI0018F13EF1|nr:glycosyltransferase family 4 protein [Aeromonas veronii]MBJ7582588.1 glycosyltransferase family 4 protein [Aeromonas veronii]